MVAQTVNDRAIREFTKLVDAQIEDLKNIVAAGAMPDWEAYRATTGKIMGLRMALDLLDEAQKIADSSI